MNPIPSFDSTAFAKRAAELCNAAVTLNREDARLGFKYLLLRLTTVGLAAEEVGKKYVDQQVYRALRSPDYKSILAKIGKMDPDTMSFKKADVASGLTESEKKKFNNFLQKMKSLNVLRSGDVPGEYIFNVRMVRLYIWLQSLEEKNRQAGK